MMLWKWQSRQKCDIYLQSTRTAARWDGKKRLFSDRHERLWQVDDLIDELLVAYDTLDADFLA